MNSLRLRAVRPILVPLLAAVPASAAIEFNRDIRPILTTHCTACHGGVKAAGKVSFVYREKALAEGKSGKRTIVPGRPDESELIRRVTSTDPEEVMPKPDHGARLSDADVAKLRTWIAEGARWSEHWSLVPPVEPAVPAVVRKDWPRQPLDAFALARMEAEGLAPSPEASPAEWLRRVSFDLTGLPPSPDDLGAWQETAKQDPQKAREQAVDRLLASPAFGERWASVWLDLARYADTYGFEKDPHRDIWPWRDWVIRAFNADMPYDQFTIRQMAGDLLENPTADDFLATAFHRNTQNNTEGGTDDEEFRTAAVHDRVNTTWTAWQATTFGCVQCHSHPYDPYQHEEYYRFKAFFDSTRDCDQNDDWPRLNVPGDAASFLRVQRLRSDLFTSGLAAVKAAGDWQALRPEAATATSGTLTIDGTGQVNATGTLPVGVAYTVRLPVAAGMTALRLSILPDSNDPKQWPERGSLVSEITLTLVRDGGTRVPIKLHEAIADRTGEPFDPLDFVTGGRGGIGGYPVLEGPRWCVLTFMEPLAVAGSLEVVMKQNAPANSGFQGTPVRHCRFEAGTTAFTTPARTQLLKEYREARAALAAGKGTAVPVLLERQAPRDTRIYIRGNRLTKDQPVEPAIPAVMNAPAPAGRASRLDMARWMVSDRNPLTARVMANRLWAELFGRGIVATLEDFGSSGAAPSNQDLLDHLALRFARHHHWSVKALLREIALSAVYGQSGRSAAALTARDPDNALLARGPRKRLTAEMVRDQALALSGLLSGKQFGPPVYPPQPDGVWSTVYNGQAWTTSQGEDRYRRAIYTYVKRTSGYPAFLAFDAPSRDLCTARRVPTNTPLQALVTMNDPAYLEIAAALARRMEREGASPAERITRGCRLLTLTDPPAALTASLLRLYEGALADYRSAPERAAKAGGSPEAAALTLVANTLLNCDAALNR